MESIKSAVGSNMFRVERVREEDLERIEAQRRRQAEARQQQLRAAHPDNSPETGGETEDAIAPVIARGRGGRRLRGGGRRRAMPMPPPGAPEAAPPPKPQTVRRERPKIGRNDPCWCGSGKKYKQCHYREDQAAAAAGAE